MPKKRNFLGGMQNYNPKNGEYESRLTKADGTPATKENMPGGEDNKKSFKSFRKDEGNIVGESTIFADLKEGDYYNLASGGRLSYDFIERHLTRLKEKVGEEGWNYIKDNKHFIEGYLVGDSDAEELVNILNPKTNKEPREGATHEYLNEEYLEDFYERAGGDEDKMLSLIRDDKQHQDFNNKKPESGWSMNEIQGIVEAFVSGKKKPTVYNGVGDYLDKTETKTETETVKTIDSGTKKKGDEAYNKWAKLDKEDRPYLSDYLYSEVFNKDREKTHDYLVSISKNPNRKDKYGNLLVSDRAFKAGQRGARKYLEESLEYDDMDSLRNSNVFLGYMEDAVNEAIMEEGLDEEFDMTYQDINEILGSVLGEEIDMESYGTNATKGWTRKPYKGYQPN